MPHLLEKGHNAIQGMEGALWHTVPQQTGYCGMHQKQDALQNHRQRLTGGLRKG